MKITENLASQDSLHSSSSLTYEILSSLMRPHLCENI